MPKSKKNSCSQKGNSQITGGSQPNQSLYSQQEVYYGSSPPQPLPMNSTNDLHGSYATRTINQQPTNESFLQSVRNNIGNVVRNIWGSNSQSQDRQLQQQIQYPNSTGYPNTTRQEDTSSNSSANSAYNNNHGFPQNVDAGIQRDYIQTYPQRTIGQGSFSSSPYPVETQFYGNTNQTYGEAAQPVEPAPPSQKEKELMEEIEKMKKERERYELEQEEDRRKRRREQMRRNNELMEQMEKEQNEQNELEVLRRHESQIRMEREADQLKKENEHIAKQKEESYEEEMLNLKRKGEQEMEDIQYRRQREQAAFDRLVAEKDQQFEEKTLQYHNDEQLRKQELIRAQEEHEERVRQIYEELERKQEELRRNHEENMNQMKKLREQIEQMFKYKVWNEIIERCWTNRLNVLRNSNRKVSELFHRFYNEVNIIQKHIDNSKDVTREIQRVEPVLKALLEAVTLEKELMSEESENLEIQWQNTGKSFVRGIQVSVYKVKSACENLETALRSYEDWIKQGFMLSLHGHHLKQTKLFFDNLSNHSTEIPTLAELKRNYSGDINNETPSNHSQEVVPYETNSVKIEEIE